MSFQPILHLPVFLPETTLCSANDACFSIHLCLSHVNVHTADHSERSQTHEWHFPCQEEETKPKNVPMPLGWLELDELLSFTKCNFTCYPALKTQLYISLSRDEQQKGQASECWIPAALFYCSFLSMTSSPTRSISEAARFQA